MQNMALSRNHDRKAELQGRTGGSQTLPHSKGGSAWASCFLRSPQHHLGFPCAFYVYLILRQIPASSRAGRQQPPRWALQALTELLEWR